MSRTVLYSILALSLAFNIFFAVGYFKAQKSLQKIETPKERIAWAASKLSLNQSQQKALAQIVTKAAELRKKLKKRQRETTRLSIDELKKASPDIELLKRSLEEMEEQKRRMRNEIMKEWREFYTSLTPRQREKVRKLLKNRPSIRKKLIIPELQK
ncbi:Spy/CpxP family protein refolding chaperone [Hydrogenimonas sp.]